MNLSELGIPDLKKLQSMSEEELEKYFSRFLEVCRPKEPTKTKTKIKDPASVLFGEMAKQYGVDISKYIK